MWLANLYLPLNTFVANQLSVHKTVSKVCYLDPAFFFLHNWHVFWHTWINITILTFHNKCHNINGYFILILCICASVCVLYIHIFTPSCYWCIDLQNFRETLHTFKKSMKKSWVFFFHSEVLVYYSKANQFSTKRSGTSRTDEENIFPSKNIFKGIFITQHFSFKTIAMRL